MNHYAPSASPASRPPFAFCFCPHIYIFSSPPIAIPSFTGVRRIFPGFPSVIKNKIRAEYPPQLFSSHRVSHLNVGVAGCSLGSREDHYPSASLWVSTGEAVLRFLLFLFAKTNFALAGWSPGDTFPPC